MTTVRQLVDDAIERIGEVAGVGVEQYTEDNAFNSVIRTFDMLFRRKPWDAYCRWVTVTLDGTTGVITTDAFERVVELEDFIHIYRADTEEAVLKMPRGVNPSRFVTGSRPIYYEGLFNSHARFLTRRLQFYPITATGSLDIRIREYPAPAEGWDWTDEIYINENIIVPGAAAHLIRNDNPGAADDLTQEMEDHLSVLENAEAGQGISIRGSSAIPSEWYP